MDARVIYDGDDSRLRLQTIVRLRWFAVVGQLVAILISLGLGFELPVGTCLVFVAMSAWLNVFLRIRYPARHRLSVRFATTMLAYDLMQLSALLYLTGGVENPFTVLIVAPVTVSAATLPPRHTILLGVAAVVATALLVVFHLPLPWYPGQQVALPMLYKLGELAAIAACTLFLALYCFRLSKESRQMSAALAATELVLAREQKLHALDGLAAAAAHELGTPLATIVLVTKELERELPKHGPVAEDLALLRSQAQRCREILQKLTQRPKEQDPLHVRLGVAQLIEEAAEPYRALSTAISIDVGPDPDTEGAARREPVGERRPGLIYGLGNLVENAIDFARSRVEISAAWTDRQVVVTVRDDGPGFPADLIESIGEPFVTTRPAARARGLGAGVGMTVGMSVGMGGAVGEAGSVAAGDDEAGLGLGFFIAKTLLERSGATLTLSNGPVDRPGAVVRITWPRATFEASDAGTTGDWRRFAVPRSAGEIARPA